MPDTVPEAVRRLLLGRIGSIAELEVLLLLLRTAPDEWDAARLAREQRVDAAWAAEQLASLARSGLLREDAAHGRYRFEPATPEIAKAVEALAAYYADRPLRVVALLYSQPLDRIRGLADAFRIRREEDDE